MLYAVRITILTFYTCGAYSIQHTQSRRCLTSALGELAKQDPPSCMVCRALCELQDSSESDEYSFSVAG